MNAPRPPLREGLRRLYANQVNLDFERLWRRSVVLSLVVLLIAGGAWLFRGLNLGIEFEGGVSWEVSIEDRSTPRRFATPWRRSVSAMPASRNSAAAWCGCVRRWPSPTAPKWPR